MHPAIRLQGHVHAAQVGQVPLGRILLHCAGRMIIQYKYLGDTELCC